MNNYTRIAIMMLLICVFVLPTSAYASSNDSSHSKQSFFSSLTSKVTFLFTGHKQEEVKISSSSNKNEYNNDNKYNGNNGTTHNSDHPSNNSNHNSDNDNFNYNACHSGKGNDGLWNWLGAKDCGEDDSWDDGVDSFTLWMRYYSY